MPSSLKPLTTTLIGGAVFLLPLVVVIFVVGQGLALVQQAVEPVVALLPERTVAGIALVTLAELALLLVLCFAAGLLARAAAARSFSARFEQKLLALYPRYSVIKGMSQGLHGALGQQVLKPVLASFDDQQQLAYDIERLDDGRVVLFLPGAPDPWSGSVLIVAGDRVQALDVSASDVTKAMQGIGFGLAALLRRTAPMPDAPRQRT